MNLFIENFKLIRVLHLECIVSIPKSVETMIHLRYLCIALSESVSVIPDSFDNLRNLETLVIEGSGHFEINFLARSIFKLRRLRNLYLDRLVPLAYQLDEVVWNLQVLCTSTCWCDGEQTFAVALDKLPCVRELKIRFIRNLGEAKKAVDFLEGLHHLRYLQTLKMQDFPMLPSDLSSFPMTITQLTLRDIGLREGGGMTVLGNLPNLQILKTKDCYIKNLHVFGDSFPRLEVLKLQCLEQVKEWKQEEGAMPRLRYLVIEGCVDQAPSGTMEFDCLAEGGGVRLQFGIDKDASRIADDG